MDLTQQPCFTCGEKPNLTYSLILVPKACISCQNYFCRECCHTTSYTFYFDQDGQTQVVRDDNGDRVIGPSRSICHQCLEERKNLPSDMYALAEKLYPQLLDYYSD